MAIQQLLAAYGAAAGGGSFATWNPADTNANLALSGGNLVATRDASAAGWRSSRATISKSSGKWYFEVLRTAGTDKSQIIAGLMIAGNPLTNYPGQNPAPAFGVQALNATDVNRYQNGFINTIAGQSDVAIGGGFQFAIDAALGRGWVKTIAAAGWMGGGNPATDTSPTFTWTAGSAVFPAVGINSSGNAVTANFGASAFSGSVPSGFSSGWF